MSFAVWISVVTTSIISLFAALLSFKTLRNSVREDEEITEEFTRQTTIEQWLQSTPATDALLARMNTINKATTRTLRQIEDAVAAGGTVNQINAQNAVRSLAKAHNATLTVQQSLGSASAASPTSTHSPCTTVPTSSTTTK